MATAGGVYRLTSQGLLTIKTVAPLVPRSGHCTRLTASVMRQVTGRCQAFPAKQ
jgi:hypothetical protein